MPTTYAATRAKSGGVSVAPTAVFATAATLATATGVLSSAMTNESTEDEEVEFFLHAPTAGTYVTTGYVELYLVYASGASGAYEEGSASVFPARGPDYVFQTLAGTTLDQATPLLKLKPRDFKVIVRNVTGQTFTTAWTLHMTKVSSKIIG